MIKLLKKAYTKLKEWWNSPSFERKLKKIRLGLTILSVPIILWKTSPRAFLKDFWLLLKNRSKYFLSSLAIGGILANTPLDAIIYRSWKRKFKDKAWVNQMTKWVKKGGEYADLYLPFLVVLLFITKPLTETEKNQKTNKKINGCTIGQLKPFGILWKVLYFKV
jgi:hypothetical protein